MTDGDLPIWVVYDHPTDFPDMFVAREHLTLGPNAGPTSNVLVSSQLWVLQAELESRGLTKLARHPDDDPVILETWI